LKEKIQSPEGRRQAKEFKETIKKLVFDNPTERAVFEIYLEQGWYSNPALRTLVGDKSFEEVKKLLPQLVREYAQKAPETPPRKLKPEYIVAIIGAAATLLAALIGILPQIFKPVMPTTTNTPTITATFTQSPAATFTNLSPSETPTPSITPTTSFTPTSTPLPAEITDSKGVTMRLVPAGEFTMGSETGSDDERPIHIVYLGSYYMDVNEVTNDQYRVCVKSGSCSIPKVTDMYYFSRYANHPVVYVTWEQANDHCIWRGGRLPTESEWEKAARGTDRRNYPSGEGIDCKTANYLGCFGNANEVGSYTAGKSVYGMYDMAGNVWEWVDSWYEAYPNSTTRNSNYGVKYRVLRGGSWADVKYLLRTTERDWLDPAEMRYYVGFRCARDAQP